MSERVYLDWNATAPLRPQARAAIIAALEQVGNPSSVHAEGRRARDIIERARGQVADLVGARAEEVVFTSGGTEANVLALSSAIETADERRPRERLLVSAIEHPSVLGGGRFPRGSIAIIRVTPDGQIDLAHLKAAVQRSERALVSIMLANNETGAIQPVAEAAAIVHAGGGLLHVDAVQAVGRMAVDADALDADLLTISAHKLGGPHGIGALVRCARGLHFPDPLLKGGGQERGLRAGTENVAAIAGFGVTAEIVGRDWRAEAERLAHLRRRLEAGLREIAPQTMIFSEKNPRVPNTTLFADPGIKAETALIALDLAGVAASSGAACSSGKVAPSHVLAAMGIERTLAAGAIRVSLGYASTEKDVERFLQAWRRCIASLAKDQHGVAA